MSQKEDVRISSFEPTNRVEKCIQSKNNRVGLGLMLYSLECHNNPNIIGVAYNHMQV